MLFQFFKRSKLSAHLGECNDLPNTGQDVNEKQQHLWQTSFFTTSVCIKIEVVTLDMIKNEKMFGEGLRWDHDTLTVWLTDCKQVFIINILYSQFVWFKLLPKVSQRTILAADSPFLVLQPVFLSPPSP